MDPYVYHGTNVLRNLREIRDRETFERFDADVTGRRLRQLRLKPLPGRFDIPHLRAIHRRIFQDLFDWAGQFRTVNISRSGQVPFCFADQIEPSLRSLFDKLAREDRLEKSGRAGFCERAAWYMGELNAIHPFREGNGRTQREFIRELAVNSGLALDWSRVDAESMREASQRSFLRGDNSALARILTSATA